MGYNNKVLPTGFEPVLYLTSSVMSGAPSATRRTGALLLFGPRNNNSILLDPDRI